MRTAQSADALHANLSVTPTSLALTLPTPQTLTVTVTQKTVVFAASGDPKIATVSPDYVNVKTLTAGSGTATFTVTPKAVGNARVGLIDLQGTYAVVPVAVSTTTGTPTLSVAKTDNGGWTIGQSGAHYTVFVGNYGTAATFGTITVTDTLPSGITLLAKPSGTGWTCTGRRGGSAFSCTSSTAIASNRDGALITLPVAVGPSTPIGEITNTALAYGGGDPVHATPATATTGADFTDIAGPPPALAIAKRDNGPWTIGQSDAQYRLVVSNNGKAPTSGTITVTDTLPSGLTLSAAPSGTGWACTGSSGSTALSCTSTNAIGSASSGAPITVPVVIGASTPTGTKAITNTANTYGGGDPAHATSASAASGSDATTVKPSKTSPEIFAYTGAAQSFVVPNGVTHVTIAALGAEGDTHFCGGIAGLGASVTATIAVVPLETLMVYVGGGGLFRWIQRWWQGRR